LFAEYLSKEPAPDDRLEAAIASLQAMYANTHRKTGDPLHQISEFMLFRHVWGGEDVQEEASLSTLLSEFGQHNQVR